MDSIFTGTERFLQKQLKAVSLDYQAFDSPVRACELSRCKATCCHDGVQLSKEDAEKIDTVVTQFSAELSSYGLDVSSSMTMSAAKEGRFKTVARPAVESELAEDFPAHFPKTRCVFLDDQFRCGLQRLAMDQNKSPWYYKPFTCWIHPLLLREEGDRLLLTIVGVENDPQKATGYPGYGSCTHCGRRDPSGTQAKLVLKGELEGLGVLANRDFVAELNADEVDWYN